jgi:hypothetical protein
VCVCVCVYVCEIFEDSNATLIFDWVYYSENHRLRSFRQKAPLFRRADARVYPCLSMGQNIALQYTQPTLWSLILRPRTGHHLELVKSIYCLNL